MEPTRPEEPAGPQPQNNSPSQPAYSPQPASPPVLNQNFQQPSNPPASPAFSTRPGMVVGNFGPDLPPEPKNSKKKKLFVAGGITLVLTLLGVGYVFGYHIPNQPENVYRIGLDRSGDAIHKMVLSSIETEKLEQIKKSEFNGSLEITSDEFNANGTFTAKLDPTKSDSTLDVKFKEKDQPEEKYTFKLLTELQDGKRFPNIYFQLSGLKNLEMDSLVPGLSDYDGKWIAVEADYLESLGAGFLPPEEETNKENISAEEVAELIRIISETNNEYLFTTETDKAVLENREFLGKEKTAEGINAFHYKVGINRENAIKYCKAISERTLSTRAVKKFMDADDQEIAKQKESATKDCDESGKDIKSDETYDMWVDAKYKVIHKLRFYEEQNKTDKYTDVGQIYTGGDKLSFFTLYHSDENNLNVKFTIDVDIKANNSKAEITASQTGEDSFNGRASLEAKPYSGEINTSKPEGAIPLSEILAKFGMDPTGVSGVSPAPDSSFDAELFERCAAAYEAQANNNGQGAIPAECQ